MLPWDRNAKTAKALNRLAAAVMAAGAVCLLGAPAQAQSLHGCVGLENTPVPSVEGPDGTFFRMSPDLQMDTRLSDAMTRDIGTLSNALAAGGTQLVFVPIPTKRLVSPDALGAEAARLGYNDSISRALYADTIAALRAAGVTTVDALEALAGQSSDEPVFFRTDPRMTNFGLRLLAEATGREMGEHLHGTTEFKTTIAGELALESHTRFLLQLACQAELPPVTTPKYVTKATKVVADEPGIVVVGSTITSDGRRHFPGFLADTLGRHMTGEVFAETAFAALASYLTSNDFRDDRPEVIVWHAPIWENPARFGDQPVRELIAAAKERCGVGSAFTNVDGELRADMAHVAVSPTTSLMLDTGEVPVSEVTFRFSGPDGRNWTRSVIRRDAAPATTKMFVPLTWLGSEDIEAVTIETTAPLESPTISVCEG